MTGPAITNLSCPLPLSEYPEVRLAHGGGGTLMHQLIERMFFRAFGAGDGYWQSVHDSAVLELNRGRVAFSTDSYVVKPLFFPGGDIGCLAVNGTVNDLAMSGARPTSLAISFIIEEGLPMTTLWEVVQSVRNAAERAGVRIVTGDTKVVDKGMGDGIFINTSGIGVIDEDVSISPQRIEIHDHVIVNGDLGRHGIAIMAVREGLEFESDIESDTMPLNGVVAALLQEGIRIHCLRDLTRGGLAGAVNEIAGSCRHGIFLNESSIPVREDVRGACEILGFDPLYVANEGRFVAFVPPHQSEHALAVLTTFAGCEKASAIGRVVDEPRSIVQLQSAIGATRILDMISGEQLPRIC